MKFRSLVIRNFKSIRDLYIDDIENALIVVGKNSTGKSSILEAVRLVTGDRPLREEDFCPDKSNIEIQVELEFSEEDLELLNRRGCVSKYKRYDLWYQDFQNKFPAYKDGVLQFTFSANYNGEIRYGDGGKKNNKYIPQVFPKIYYIDYDRNFREIQDDIFLARGGHALDKLKNNSCMFDDSRACSNCFQCMGVIEKKEPAQLSIYETVRLLQYKVVNLDVDDFLLRLNQHFRKNSGLGRELIYRFGFDFDELLKVDMALFYQEEGVEMNVPLETMSAGMKSIYVLSLLETYIGENSQLPCIIMMEEPEIYLHPQMQKVAGEILYRLSERNQVIFSTHSPNLIVNFHTRQLRQVLLDENFHTIVRRRADVNAILDDLGYTAADLMNVNFVFFVEGKQDKSRLPLLLEHYYSEIRDRDGNLNRIAIISTNSCTNIKTYANLKYMNSLYMKDNFLMIRDGDGKDREELVSQLCGYYDQRQKEDGNLPRIRRENVLVLKYYSFENYFLHPEIMEKIGVVDSKEDFYKILCAKYRQYLYRLSSFQKMKKETGVYIRTPKDVEKNLETILIYGRGHNLYDIFYGRYKGAKETEILKKYIQAAPREIFADILDPIDGFAYFDSRKIRKTEER